MDDLAFIRSHIRTVPDWPAAGVQFRDITPLLQNPRAFRVLIDQFVHRYFDQRPAAIAGVDAAIFRTTERICPVLPEASASAI